jgi:hypothetical protein
VVYGRNVAGRTLDLEPSGALLSASLVMRDRQTDSWWSIMSSKAIGGPLEGTRLPELGLGEKSTWGEWRRRHPDALVLSVDGNEHVATNPYDRYFSSEGTFRNADLADERLSAKEPIFAFHLDGAAWAVPHRAFAGGELFDLPDRDRKLLLFREKGASIYASTEAWLVAPEVAGKRPRARRLLEAARAGEAGFERVEGFDTFWYTWVGVNRDSKLLR